MRFKSIMLSHMSEASAGFLRLTETQTRAAGQLVFKHSQS